VGLDGEWKPGSRTPVSILQVATRTDAFVVDLFAVAKRDAPDDAREAFDAVPARAPAQRRGVQARVFRSGTT
jgi:hypothetical protein